VIVQVEFNREEEVEVFKRYLTKGKASWLILNRRKSGEMAE